MKAAIEYGNRVGSPDAGLNLSPLQLEMRMRVLREEDRRRRIDLAEAVAVAMSGKEEAWDELSR